ncbi:MAG: SpoIIE family protein phosphatase [Caldithrix sp.]|nr:SpoIIE family protein phosphatase [Caldithrix sp.]
MVSAKNSFFREGFWKSLSKPSYILFLVAVFFLFASLGFIIDLFNHGETPLPDLLYSILFSGVVAVGYAYAATRYFPLVLGMIVVHFLASLFIPSHQDLNPTLDQLQSRLTIDGIGILIAVISGYVLFVIFISKEGTRQFQLKAEIRLAQQIHDVLVKPVHQTNESFEIFGKVNPADDVGGDLVDVYESKKHTICYVADVSGHGVQASVLMGMFKSAMHVRLSSFTSLSDIISEVNRSILPLKKKDMFITTAIIQLNRQSGTDNAFLVAGHLPIMHYQSATQQVFEYNTPQLPLGVKQNYWFDSQSFNWQSGDVMILFTDGLIEASKNQDVEKGMAMLKQKFIYLCKQHYPLDLLYNGILDALRIQGHQTDDKTLLIIKHL